MFLRVCFLVVDFSHACTCAHTQSHKITGKLACLHLILPVAEGLGTSVWHWGKQCLFSDFQPCSHWGFVASGCLWQDRTLLDYPELTWSAADASPVTKIQGKTDILTTRLKTESKAVTEWILEADVTGLRLESSAVERHRKQDLWFVW